METAEGRRASGLRTGLAGGIIAPAALIAALLVTNASSRSDESDSPVILLLLEPLSRLAGSGTPAATSKEEFATFVTAGSTMRRFEDGKDIEVAVGEGPATTPVIGRQLPASAVAVEEDAVVAGAHTANTAEPEGPSRSRPMPDALQTLLLNAAASLSCVKDNEEDEEEEEKAESSTPTSTATPPTAPATSRSACCKTLVMAGGEGGADDPPGVVLTPELSPAKGAMEEEEGGIVRGSEGAGGTSAGRLPYDSKENSFTTCTTKPRRSRREPSCACSLEDEKPHALEEAMIWEDCWDPPILVADCLPPPPSSAKLLAPSTSTALCHGEHRPEAEKEAPLTNDVSIC